MLETLVPGPADTERADLDLLGGPEAEHVLRAVLDAEGAELVDWATHAVHHRPGVGVTVGWTVTWRTMAAAGQDYLLGSTAPLPEREETTGVQQVRVDARTVHVWRHPADPALPGLAAASSIEALDGMLGERPRALDLVTYRPMRRAVLRAQLTDRVVYLKVVRPHTAELLLRRHTMLADVGVPVAPARLVADGVLALDEVPGRPLTVALAADGAADVDPATVTDLLARLPAEAVDLPVRPAWSARLDHYAAAAVAAVPEAADQIRRLADEAAELRDSADPGPIVPTHGDLHDQNLLLDGPEVVGLLDVDAVGPGHRVDDLACLLGHLAVLSALAPQTYPDVPGTVGRWAEAFGRTVDPVSLHARAAAVVISLVAGARREDGVDWLPDARARIAAAEALVATARNLRDLSSSPPSPLINGGER